GGGTLLSSGIYAVQLLQWLFGAMKSIGGVRSVTESGGEFSFEKTETGYQTSLDGLPEGELEFTLSESAKPKAPRGHLNALQVGGIAGAVALLSYVQLKRNKKLK
ncbi:MAG: hypothetical protein IKB91_08800, partial [Anaerotignum sp.]|nr:hypothetical protein [Anaerotignum sp.]